MTRGLGLALRISGLGGDRRDGIDGIKRATDRVGAECEMVVDRQIPGHSFPSPFGLYEQTLFHKAQMPAVQRKKCDFRAILSAVQARRAGYGNLGRQFGL